MGKLFSCFLLSLFAVAAAVADDEVLFSFARKTWFYSFCNKESQMKMSAGEPDGLTVVYHSIGGSAYIGLGIDFGHLPQAWSDWTRFGADGNLIFTVRADRSGQAEVTVRTVDGQSFRNSFPVGVEWSRVTLPFRGFTAAGVAWNPVKQRIVKLELRLPRGKEENRFQCREIALSAAKKLTPAERKNVLAGRVVDPAGKPLAGAIVTVSKDGKDRYGWYEVDAVATGPVGRFVLPVAFAAESTALVQALTPAAAATGSTASVAPERNFFIEWDFTAPFEFDEVRLVNAGFGAPVARSLNTRSGSVQIRTAADSTWRTVKEFRDNTADVITLPLGKTVTATAFRLEIEAGTQPGAADVVQLREIEFYRAGRPVPLSTFNYEKQIPLTRNLRSSRAAEDQARVEFAIDGDRASSWRTLSRAAVAAGAWRQAWQLEAAAPGRVPFAVAIDPAAPERAADLTFTLVPVKIETANLRVNPAQVIRPINPLIYGANMGLWHNGDFDQPAVVAAARDLGVTFIRYPGGGRSQTARWQREEGRWDSRPLAGKPGDNCVLTPKQLDRYIAFCRQVGAEPLLTLNQRTDDVDNLADLVRYLNVEKKYGVKYFEVGNEPEGYIKDWGFGANWVHHRDTFRSTYRKAAEIHRRYAEKLKAIDPEIVLMGPVTANADFFDLAIPPFWEVLGNTLDVLAVHRYPQCDLKPGSAHLSDAALLDRPTEWTKLGAQLAEYNRRYSPGFRPPYAVTEWHTAYHSPGPRQQQLVGGLYVAGNLCEMIKNGIDLANLWVLTGCGEYNLFNSGKFRVKPGEIGYTPAYYCFRTLAKNFRGDLVDAESNRKPLRVYAAVDGDRLNVVCLNVSSDTAFSLTGMPPGWRPSSAVVVDRFHNGVDIPFAGDGFVMPARSMVLLRFTH